MFTAQSTRQLPQSTGQLRIKKKTILLCSLMLVSLSCYSYYQQPVRIVQITGRDTQLIPTLDKLSDLYIQSAKKLTLTPGSQCYKLGIKDCLETLTPDRPQLSGTSNPINLELQQLGYRTRLNAVNLAISKSGN
jgi:hypothetical protein